MNKRKIAVFTGSRSEYGILKPVIRQIANSPKLELQLIAGGTHLLADYGSTYKNIEDDKIPIMATVDFSINGDKPGKMSFEVGNAITKTTKILLDLNPDILIVVGDRSEAFAAAASAALLPMIVGHIHGGEISAAGVDESMRHAITKLSHIHFASTKKSAKRIIQMGENPKNVFLVGAPGLDDFLAGKEIDILTLQEKLGLSFKKPVIVILQHPVTTSINSSGEEMRKTLEAVSSFEGTKIAIYPNADPGSGAMVSEIEKYRKTDDFYIYPNLERDIYINLLKNADVLVGNSSGGIIETASILLETVNIGSRQFGRERNDNVIDVDYNYQDIHSAVKKALNDEVSKDMVKKTENIYGNGTSAKKIVQVLEAIELGPELLQKHFYDRTNE